MRLPRGHRFRPKFDFTVMAQNHDVDHLGSTLWPMGSHWVQRMGQNRKKLPCPKNSIMRLPRGHRFRPKFDFTVKSRCRPPRVHFLANGVPLHRKKITKPSNSIFRLPRGHRFRPKFDFTVMAPNHGGDSLGSILGQWDPIGSKKWVTTVKNYHALKFDYAPRSSISTKSLSKKKKGLQ